MSNIQFRSAEHRDFFLENMNKCRVNDSYHRAFFYVMGIASEIVSSRMGCTVDGRPVEPLRSAASPLISGMGTPT